MGRNEVEEPKSPVAGTEGIALQPSKGSRSRMVIPILLLHFLVIPTLLYQFLVHFEKPVMEIQVALAESFVNEIQAQMALNQVLTGGDVHQVQRTVDHVSMTYGLLGMRVYDNQGRLRAARGEVLDEVRPFADQVIVGSGQVEGVMVVTRLVKNQEGCHSCHDSKKPHIGIIQAALPIHNYAARMREERNTAVVVVIAILAVASSLIYLFHRHFVAVPVRKIMNGMRKVKEGDLSVRIPMGRKDEMGFIAENFNRVVESLGQARSELEKRHKADMHRAEQLATVGEIAAGLAHEVKNPIAGIESALEVVLDESETDWQHREIIQQMIKETRRINSIINQLLDYARARESHPDWYEVEMIVDDIKSMFTPQCQHRHASFHVAMGQNLGQMFVDANELKQVFINILRNSLEALSIGGRIEMTVSASNEHVTFVVSDNGPGMDPATSDKIFQPFFTTKPDGTGLGLAIVHRVVESVGGKMRVETQPSIGTSFTIELPRESRVEDTHH